eukprot:s4713_g7.t1
MAEVHAGGKRGKTSAEHGVPWGLLVVLLVLLGLCYQLLQQEATRNEVTVLLAGQALVYCLAACIDRMNSGQSRISAGQGRRAAGPQGRELHRAAGLRTSIFGAAESRSALPQGPPELPRDVQVLVFFVLAIFIMNWSVRIVLVEPLARLVVGVRGDVLVKFSQSVLEALIYGTFSLIGISIVPAQPWSWPSANWWRGFDSGEHLVMRSDLRCFYILYGARYIQAAVTVLLEPKRKDFLEMMESWQNHNADVHHVVTIGVVYVSYLGGYNRVGVVVMVLLDPADVPLHLAKLDCPKKLCKYTAEQLKINMWQFVADRLFEFFAVLFAVTRLIIYDPEWAVQDAAARIRRSAHIESAAYFKHSFAATVCVVLLYLLMVLQVYWFGLILKVAIRLLQGHGVEDIRSDDEDEEPEKKDSKKDS